jgi:hypothetical protein
MIAKTPYLALVTRDGLVYGWPEVPMRPQPSPSLFAAVLAALVTAASWLLFAMVGKTRCAEVTGKGPCRWPAKYGSRCLGCAAKAGDPAALIEQRRRLLSRRKRVDFSAYRDRPVEFARDIFGLELWSRQAELAQSVADHDRVSCTSGHKTGKSLAIALLAWWFVLTRADGRVVLMSNTGRQLRATLWREVKRLALRARVKLDCEINDLPERGVVFADGREIAGFSTDESERAAGISGDELLLIYDEASGMPPTLYEAIMGIAGGDAKIALLGNPTKSAGPFFDSHHDSAALWHTLTISSEETPNVVSGERLIPGLATRRWRDERRADWGDGPLFDVRVRGRWPSQSTHAVIGMQLVDERVAAWRREAFAESTAPTKFGVDVSRFGDNESVIFAMRGHATLPPWVFRGLDTIALAREVRRIAQEVGREGEVVTCNVDETGLGGGLVDVLRDMGGLRVVGINAGESPGNPQYQRRRDELWFSLAAWLKAGGTIPGDRKLVGELVAVEYSFAPTGKIVVEPKDGLSKRLGRSPDRSDALALAVFEKRMSAWAEWSLSSLNDDPLFGEEDYERELERAWGRDVARRFF